MDSLTPDKDDMERFKQERKRSVAGSEPADKKQETIAAAREPVAPLPAPGTRKAAAEPKKAGRESPAGKSSAWLTVLVLILVIAVAAASFWQIFQQRGTIDQLEQQLTEANQYINQNKLVMARLEGTLNETEATVVQSDSRLSSRLEGIDSEIRKLWDLANKRNAATIREHDNRIAALQKTAKGLEASLKETETKLAAASSQAAEQQARLAPVLKTVDALSARLAQMENSVAERMERMEKDRLAQASTLTKHMENLNAKLAEQAGTSKVDGRLKEVETAIDSIDMSRQQLNRRIVELERRLNETQLRLNSQPPAGG